MRWIPLALMALVVGSCTTHRISRESTYPSVTLDYLRIFDDACARMKGVAPNVGAMAEVERLLPEFRATWAAEEQALLATTAEIVGAKWQYREAVATLHVCEGMPKGGTSYPLLINTELFLDATEGMFRHRDDVFVDNLYHEVLHRYLRDLIGAGVGEPMRNTPLMQRHSAEPLFVRTHIHLYAVQRAVYVRLGRDPELIEEFLSKVPFANPANKAAYVRAHQIAKAEGDALIAELRSLARDE